jgi:hypothetical protein
MPCKRRMKLFPFILIFCLCAGQDSVLIKERHKQMNDSLLIKLENYQRHKQMNDSLLIKLENKNGR